MFVHNVRGEFKGQIQVLRDLGLRLSNNSSVSHFICRVRDEVASKPTTYTDVEEDKNTSMVSLCVFHVL